MHTIKLSLYSVSLDIMKHYALVMYTAEYYMIAFITFILDNYVTVLHFPIGQC